MKIRNSLLLPVGLLLASLGACDKETYSEESRNYNTVNHFTPTDPEGKVTVASGNYRFTYNSNGVLSIASSDLAFNGRENSLVVDQMSFQSWNTNVGQLFRFGPGSGKAESLPVLNLKGAVSGLFYFVNDISVPDIDGIPTKEYGPMVVMQYDLGSQYKVRTFCRDSYFYGKTIVHGNMGGQAYTYESEKPMYRIAINRSLDKADVVFYNLQLADKMPAQKAVVFKGLKVEYTARGYVISGQNLVPLTVEGTGNNSFTENPRFTLSSLTIQTVTDDLTGITIDYSLPGVGNAQFSGSYVITDLTQITQ